MKKTRLYLAFSYPILLALFLNSSCQVARQDSAKTDSVKGVSMDIKSLENRILQKDWDALDIVDTAQNPSEALPLLSELYQNKDPEVRLITINCLKLIRDPQATKSLIKALEDEDNEIRTTALSSVRERAETSDLPELIKNLANKDEFMRAEIALIIGNLGDSGSINLLKDKIQVEKNADVIRAIKLALAKLGNTEQKEFFAANLKINDSHTRYQAIQDLRYINDRNLAKYLIFALDDHGDTYIITSLNDPHTRYARVCDAAISLADQLLNHPFAFEAHDYKNYSDDEINQAREFLRNLK